MKLNSQTVVIVLVAIAVAFFLGRSSDSTIAGEPVNSVQPTIAVEAVTPEAEAPGSGENEECEEAGAEAGEVEDEDEAGDVDRPCPETAGSGAASATTLPQ